MPYLAGMTEKASRIISFLRGAVSRGMSADSIIRTARELDLPTYRRSEMLSDIRVLQGAEELGDRMKYVNRDATISDSLYAPTGKGVFRNYLTFVKLSGVDSATGEAVERVVGVSHDTLLTRGEIEEEAESMVEETSPTIEIESMMPIGGRRYG